MIAAFICAWLLEYLDARRGVPAVVARVQTDTLQKLWHDACRRVGVTGQATMYTVARD